VFSNPFPQAGSWNWVIFAAPSIPSHSMIKDNYS